MKSPILRFGAVFFGIIFLLLAIKNIEMAIGIVIMIGFIVLMIKFSNYKPEPNVPTYNPNMPKVCPRCGSKNHSIIVDKEVVVPAKIKTTSSVNLNPLKPFTIMNHKDEVVSKEITRDVSKFACNDCGYIYK